MTYQSICLAYVASKINYLAYVANQYIFNPYLIDY